MAKTLQERFQRWFYRVSGIEDMRRNQLRDLISTQRRLRALDAKLDATAGRVDVLDRRTRRLLWEAQAPGWLPVDGIVEEKPGADKSGDSGLDDPDRRRSSTFTDGGPTSEGQSAFTHNPPQPLFPRFQPDAQGQSPAAMRATGL